MAGYLGAIPVPQATQNRESFTASANQTSFATAGYTVGFVDAFLNGVRLNTADFTATNGSDIVLASGAAVNDILDVISYATFEVNAQTFTGTTTMTDVVAASLDISGNIDIDGVTNLDVVDIDGAVDMATTLAVAGNVDFNGDLDVDGTTNLDAVDIDGAVQLDSTLTVGVDDTGYDVKFFGATASAFMQWDASGDDLILGGAAQLGIGNGSTAPTATLDVRRSDASGKIAEFHQNGGFGLEFGSSQTEAYIQAGNSQTLLMTIPSDITIDSGSEIILDADAAGIRIRDDGGDIGFIQMTSSDFILRSMVADKDILFKGNDSDVSANFTALKLDMSDAGTAIFNSRVAIANGTASVPSFTFSGDTNTGMFRGSADNLSFSTGGVTRAFLSATQLNVTGNAIFGGSAHTFAGSATVANNLTLTDGNLIIGGSGHGIDFSARNVNGTDVGGTNETLDDFETGTWTPKLKDINGNEATGYTSGYPKGTYTKIGRHVWVNFSIRITNKGSMTGGFVFVANLPFNKDSTAEGRGTGTIDYYSGFAENKSYLALDCSSTTNVLWLVGGRNATTSHYVNPAQINNSCMFKGGANYTAT